MAEQRHDQPNDTMRFCGYSATRAAHNCLPFKILLLAVVMFEIIAITLYTTTAYAQASTAKIVGHGATRCAEFSRSTHRQPISQREYLAWAQGFMSGILLGRPPGVDKNLDLNPRSFGIVEQLAFLNKHCTANPSDDFSDAVLQLYKVLRRQNAS